MIRIENRVKLCNILIKMSIYHNNVLKKITENDILKKQKKEKIWK